MLVTRNFPPLLGGMERLNTYLLDSLKRVWRVSMCGPEGAAHYAVAADDIREIKVSPLATFLVKSLWHAGRMAIRRRPQWIIAGSGLMAPIVWLSSRCSGARAAVYLHGLDVVAPSVIYRWLWLPFIRRCDVVIVNSRATMALALDKGVPSARMTVINPGTGIPALNPRDAAQFRIAHGLGDAPLMLSVGRLTQRKGLAEFVTSALPGILKVRPDALLLVIGDEARDALHGGGGGEKEKILCVARAAGVAGSIRFLGRCDEDVLQAAYQASDVHVFPVLNLPGDVEGFGMVALEAAAHGLPSVAFDVGGVSDAIRPAETGSLVMQGDYPEFGAQVLRYTGQPELRESMKEACLAFARSKAWPVFTRNVLMALEQHVDDGRA